MKKTAIISMLIACCALSAVAQNESKKFSVGFGLEAGLPTGATTNLYSFAVGLTVRFSYHVGPGFVTLTSGALGYDPKSIQGQPKKVGLRIPIRAGYKYIIAHHFFVMGEAGYSSFRSYYGQNGNLVSTTSGSFIVSPSLGVQFNAIELGLRYDADLKSNAGGLVAVRLGFNF